VSRIERLIYIVFVFLCLIHGTTYVLFFQNYIVSQFDPHGIGWGFVLQYGDNAWPIIAVFTALTAVGIFCALLFVHRYGERRPDEDERSMEQISLANIAVALIQGVVIFADTQ